MVDKRRRRKKIRIEDHSSSSESEDAESSHSDVSMKDDEGPQDSDNNLSNQENYPYDLQDNARILAHKNPAPENEFDQYFLKIVTEQFGNDLEALRRAPDFHEGSLELLVSGLKQGVNIFDQEQKRLLLKQAK